MLYKSPFFKSACGKTAFGNKAQASFELLLLVAFVIALSFLLVSYFFQESEQTKIEALAKSITLKELNKAPDFYFINSVSYNGSDSVTICLKPKRLKDEDEGEGSVKSAIEEAVEKEMQNPSVTATVLYTNEQAC